jgi:hypothetical protein
MQRLMRSCVPMQSNLADPGPAACLRPRLALQPMLDEFTGYSRPEDVAIRAHQNCVGGTGIEPGFQRRPERCNFGLIERRCYHAFACLLRLARYQPGPGTKDIVEFGDGACICAWLREIAAGS